jgi:hypothetical protein
VIVIAGHFAMHQLEHASLLPFPESSIAGTAAAELLGNRLPLAAGAKAIEDATQHDSVGRGRTSTFVVPTNGWSRKQPLDAVPQLVRDIGEFAFHIQHRSTRSRQTTAAVNSLDLLLFNRSRQRDDGDAVRRRAPRRAPCTDVPALPRRPRDGPARLHLRGPDERVARGA